MKKLPVLLFLFFTQTARSQGKGSIYYFDANWKPTQIENARFLQHTYRLNDTCWQSDFYHFTGPLIKSEQYRDKDGNQMNGVSYHYNAKGFIDSSAHFSDGKRNGESYKLFGDSLNHAIRFIYLNDTLIEKVNLDTVKKDSVISNTVEKESEFPGGVKAWSAYLLGNLKYPERAMKGIIQGQVVVRFIIDKQGFVIEPVIGHSVEYSLDAEAMRIIKNSGKWDPAFQNGHNVKSYKQQPINFKLQ